MTTTREKRSLNAEAPRAPVLLSTDGLVAVIPSEARDLQFLCSGTLSHDAALSHSRGTACRARSRHWLRCAIELDFANALSAFVILSGAKDLSCP